MKHFVNLLKLLGLIFLSMNLNSLPAVLAMELKGQESSVQLAAVVIGTILFIGVIALLWRNYRKGRAENSYRLTWKDFGIALLYWLAGRVIAIVGTLLNQVLTGRETSANDQAIREAMGSLSDSLPFLFFFMVTIGILGPILEELVFRGFFKRYFFQKKAKWLAMLVTSAVFALMHLNPLAPTVVEFFMYAGLGVIMYHAYARRGKLEDAILVHILNNLPIALALGAQVLLMG